MKPTRLTRQLIAMTSVRRCIASALLYDRASRRYGYRPAYGGGITSAYAHLHEICSWCMAQLSRLTAAA